MNLSKKTKLILSLNCCLLVLFFISYSRALPALKYKELEINGLLIHQEQYIIIHLALDKLPANRTHYESVSKKINDFYHIGGYVLAETFLIEETEERLRIFVDEGRLGTIVFKNLNTIQTLRMKSEFNLNQKVYNKYVVDKELRRLEKKFGFKEIAGEIKMADEYDKSLIQIDKKFNIFGLGTASIPLLDKIGYRYNLYLNFKTGGESEKDKIVVDLDIKTSYSKGFIPLIECYNPSLFQEEDLLIAGASAGVRYGYYGLSLDFTKSPEWTFMEAHSDYNLAPALKKYFTPQIRTAVTTSRTSRKDLGLLHYKFLVARGTLAPGITLLKSMKIYAGAGGERVNLYDPEPDPESVNPIMIKEHVETMAVFETRLVYNLSWLPPWGHEKKVELAYRCFINDRNFQEFSVDGSWDFELKYLSLYSLAFDYSKTWKKPPFYHEVSVSNQNFKGLMAEDYYTREIARNSHQLKTSLYRAFIYGGVFTDLIWFRGSGYDLRGNQFGSVAGISGHIILLDQFQFDIYYGRDYLHPSGESRNNVYLKLYKKW